VWCGSKTTEQNTSEHVDLAGQETPRILEDSQKRTGPSRFNGNLVRKRKTGKVNKKNNNFIKGQATAYPREGSTPVENGRSGIRSKGGRDQKGASRKIGTMEREDCKLWENGRKRGHDNIGKTGGAKKSF